MKITEMSAEQRPRERMIHYGPDALSDAELLAIVLRSGSRGTSALELANSMISSSGGRLAGLFNMPDTVLMSFPGVGDCKAAEIKAVFELGKRFFSEKTDTSGKSVVSARMAYDLMRPRFFGLLHEECWALVLNAHNRVTGKFMVSSGGDVSTVFDVRAVVREALARRAIAVILMHNHPTGNPHPSPADIRQTEAIHAGLSAVQIKLIDHIVVSDHGFYSFSDDRCYNV